MSNDTGEADTTAPSRVIEQGVFRSAEDITRLGMVDWMRLNGSFRDPGHALAVAANWLVGAAQYTVAEWDLTRYPARSDWPGYDHLGMGGRPSHAHNDLMRRYWQMFMVEHAPDGGDITLSDSPDFWGDIVEAATGQRHAFYGDIGQCSAQCFVMTIKKLRAGDLWISVLSETQQVIIES